MEHTVTKKRLLPTSGFGQRIRAERQRLNINQSEFAALAGVSRASQAHYELEQRVPDMNYLSALSREVDVMYLMTGERGTVAFGPKLIEPILDAIDTWAQESRRAVSNSLRAELIALFLKQAESAGRIDGDLMRQTLRLVK